jgi:adenylate cyclase
MPVSGGDHTSAVANMALEMIQVSQRLTSEFGEDVSVRIGFHAGPAIAGVIGRRKPFYDVWGDTINVAARMESSGLPGRIQITPEVKEILGKRYCFEERGLVEIKGKGLMPLFFLNGLSEG